MKTNLHYIAIFILSILLAGQPQAINAFAASSTPMEMTEEAEGKAEHKIELTIAQERKLLRNVDPKKPAVERRTCHYVLTAAAPPFLYKTPLFIHHQVFRL